MGKIVVQYIPEVENYLDNLIEILFYKEYFGFIESANNYVDRIIDFIDFNIAKIPSKISPKQLLNLGSKYILYKANSTTTWYIFFEKSDDRYLVTFITNNHSEFAGYF